MTGFYSIDAEVLLKFCRKWRLHTLVQFEASANHAWKSFQIVLSAEPFTVELDPDAEQPRVDYAAYTAEERACLQPLVGQFSEAGAKELRVVVFPRVIHLQFLPALGVTGDILQDVCHFSGVTRVRIGGDAQCVEVIVRRPARTPVGALRNRITVATKKNPGRRVSYGGTTQVVQAALLDFTPAAADAADAS